MSATIVSSDYVYQNVPPARKTRSSGRAPARAQHGRVQSPRPQPVSSPIVPRVVVTSDDVNGNVQRLRAEIAIPETNDYLRDVEIQQSKAELSLVASRPVCSPDELNTIRDHIGGLDANSLKDMTVNELYNPSVMEAAMCTFDSIFYQSPYDLGSLYLNNRIRTYIHNLRQIGVESVEGYAMLADFEDAQSMFVVKTARDPNDDRLLHELVVGVYGTNILRKYIPNFSYIFGGFKCSPPLIDPETKKVATWCLHNDNAVNYVLYENIAPATSAKEYIKTCTGKQFVNMYMQIVYALRLGLKMIDFTHYDLHADNVLMRRINDKSFQIRYETERGIEYLQADSIATIIDYGMSHLRVDYDGRSIHFGASRLIPYSIYPYRSWIFHDLYKFLMSAISVAFVANNGSVLTEAIKIFRFFNPIEDPKSAVIAQQDVYFSLPMTRSTNTLSINDYAAYIRSVCDCDFLSSVASGPLLDCERLCPTQRAVLTKVGLNPSGPIGTPDNVLEFYDVAKRLQNEGRTNDLVAISQRFPYQRAMTEHLRKMREMEASLEKARRSVRLIDLQRIGLDQLLTYNTMSNVRSMYILIAGVVDTTMELRFYYDIGLAVAESFNDTRTVDELNAIVRDFETNIRPGLEEAKQVLGINHRYLDSLTNDPSVKQAISADPRLKWYYGGRELFDIIFGRDIVIRTVLP